MIYASILAGGFGKRMHRQDLPEQYLQLGDKPIIVHTIEQFLVNPNINRIIIVAQEDCIIYTEDLIKKYNLLGKECYVISGGSNKTESIYMSVKFIEDKWGIGNEDIVVCHDAIRPFVTQRIINDNIEVTKKVGAANTAIASNDAVIESKDGVTLDSVPRHEWTFAEQTPQSYNIAKVQKMFKKALEEGVNLQTESELPRLYINYGNEINLVRGEYYNVKIINPYDLEVAEALLGSFNK